MLENLYLGYDRTLMGGPTTWHFTDTSIIELASRCARLRHLELHSEHITDESIIALARNCSDLRSLKLQCPMTDAGLIPLGLGCTLLHTLDLKTPRVTDAGIGVLSGLCHFTLYYNNHVTLAGITELIRHSPNLWHLFTLRCGNLEHDRTQARIADLIDSNLNKQRGLAEVITAS